MYSFDRFAELLAGGELDFAGELLINRVDLVIQPTDVGFHV